MELQSMRMQSPSIQASFLDEDPFRTPRRPYSRTMSIRSGRSSRVPSLFREKAEKPRRRFKSTRLVGDYEKPWLAEKDHRMKYDKIFFYGLALVGCGIGAYICYDGWMEAGSAEFCLQFEDDFSGGINPANWNHEVQINGYGTGSFDWTTTDARNAYTDANGLHIVPTFTTDDTNITPDQMMNGYTLNLTQDGSCTSILSTACIVQSNTTSGQIINPVRSARLNTKGKQSITYGKVEVVAKLPKGDWLWPAIWMMPEESYYGPWPESGEIDIMESRGNDPFKYQGGRNTVSGTLHWGPNEQMDRYPQTSNGLWKRHGDFSDDFHVFGVEWSDKYIFTYYDNVLKQTLYVPFGQKQGDMYTRGGFGQVSGTPPINPWASSSNYNAPFDRPFYLILNVAVGGTSGYFADGYDGKPWADQTKNSSLMFWNAKETWEPTWGPGDQRGMTVKSVKMWKVLVLSVEKGHDVLEAVRLPEGGVKWSHLTPEIDGKFVLDKDAYCNVIPLFDTFLPPEKVAWWTTRLLKTVHRLDHSDGDWSGPKLGFLPGRSSMGCARAVSMLKLSQVQPLPATAMASPSLYGVSSERKGPALALDGVVGTPDDPFWTLIIRRVNDERPLVAFVTRDASEDGNAPGHGENVSDEVTNDEDYKMVDAVSPTNVEIPLPSRDVTSPHTELPPERQYVFSQRLIPARDTSQKLKGPGLKGVLHCRMQGYEESMTGKKQEEYMWEEPPRINDKELRDILGPFLQKGGIKWSSY